MQGAVGAASTGVRVVATHAIAQAAGGSVSSMAGAVIDNLAHNRKWCDGLGQAAAAGALTGFISGTISGVTSCREAAKEAAAMSSWTRTAKLHGAVKPCRPLPKTQTQSPTEARPPRNRSPAARQKPRPRRPRPSKRKLPQNLSADQLRGRSDDFWGSSKARDAHFFIRNY